MNKKSIVRLLLVGAIFCIPAASTTRAQNPETGQTARYCNPLPMIIGPGGNASGDVTVILEKGKYYMFCTGGGAWISDDMLNWSFQRVENVPVAPHVVKYNGSNRTDTTGTSFTRCISIQDRGINGR